MKLSIKSLWFSCTALLLLVAAMCTAQNASKPVTETKAAAESTPKASATKEIEISMDVPLIKGATVHIINSNRNLSIQTWAEDKVKIVSTIMVEEDVKPGTGQEMFEKAGITMRSMSNRVELNARSSSITFATGYGQSLRNLATTESVASAASPSEVVVQGYGTKTLTGSLLYSNSKKRLLTIFVPENTKLDVDNRSSDILLKNNYYEAKFDLSNTNLDCQNIGKLKLLAKYSIVNAGDIDDAELEFENGTFRANDIKTLDIDSKSSTIEYEKGMSVYMRSQRDNYSIESINKAEGRKLYGEFRIDELHNSFDLEGTNADVKIRNIMPGVEKVKLDNKYADVRLPVKHLTSYAVDFQGSYSTVFAPFEKTVIQTEKSTTAKVKEEEEVKKVNIEKQTLTVAGALLPRATYNGTQGHYSTVNINLGEIAPSKFTASVSDGKGKQTKFVLVCNSCTIDFK